MCINTKKGEDMRVPSSTRRTPLRSYLDFLQDQRRRHITVAPPCVISVSKIFLTPLFLLVVCAQLIASRAVFPCCILPFNISLPVRPVRRPRWIAFLPGCLNPRRQKGNAYDVIPGYTKEETDVIYDTLLSVLCIPTKVGSHFEATSTK